MQPKTIKALKNCARCGENHDQPIVFQPLTQCVLNDAEDVIYTHWAPCPTNGEPILLIDN
jgi:hypothetical protein